MLREGIGYLDLACYNRSSVGLRNDAGCAPFSYVGYLTLEEQSSGVVAGEGSTCSTGPDLIAEDEALIAYELALDVEEAGGEVVGPVASVREGFRPLSIRGARGDPRRAAH